MLRSIIPFAALALVTAGATGNRRDVGDRRLRRFHQAPAGFLRADLLRQRRARAPSRRSEERRRHRWRARPAATSRRHRSAPRQRQGRARRRGAARFGESGVHGVVLVGRFGRSTCPRRRAVLRYRLTDSLLPKKRVDTIVTGLAQRQIPSHSLALDRARKSDRQHRRAVERRARAKEVAGAPGRDPCPELGDQRRYLELSHRSHRISTSSTARASPPDCTTPSRSR